MEPHQHTHEHSHRHGHSHDPGGQVDSALRASRRGMRALWWSFAALALTAAAQAVVVGFTGSVALLSDTLHNFADALTAVPLAVAFWLGRRAATRRFTYGLGRTEDVAGLVILLMIAASAAFAVWQAVDRLLHPRSIDNLGWLAAAGLIGFAGNELVARYRIKVGREIGSAALEADGLHARTDGFASLAVLASAGGAAIGWQWADPAVGLAIVVAILAVLWSAARQVLGRLLDAVDPELVTRADAVLAATPGVRRVDGLRLRWIGHSLHAETDLAVDAGLSLTQAHRIAHDAEHRLIHALPRLARASVHTHPADGDAHHVHERLDHHQAGARAPAQAKMDTG